MAGCQVLGRLQSSMMLQLVQQMIVAKRIIDFGMVDMALASASTEATLLFWVEECILLANHAFLDLACRHYILKLVTLKRTAGWRRRMWSP